MTSKTFSAQVDEMIERNVKVLNAVAQTAIQSLVSDVSTPIRQGGRMPVDTGFLWNSDAASLSGMPSGPTNKVKGQTYTRKGDHIVAVIAQLKPGDKFYYGWTAEYARKLNMKYGFLDAGTQNWQTYVDKAAADAIRRMK